LRRGESAEAIGVLKDAVKAKPEDPAPALALSSIYLRHLRKTDFATKYAEMAIEAAPREFGGYEALWEIGQSQGDRELSMKALDRAAESDSEETRFWLSLADFYSSSTPGDAFLDDELLPRIGTAMARAIDTAGEDAESLARVGDFYLIHQQYEPAVGIYRRAEEVNSMLPKIQEKLASSLMETGRTDEAIPVFEKVILRNPLDLAAYDQLRQLYIDREEYSKALACVEQALIIDKTNGFLYDQLVKLLMMTGEFDRAADRLAKARELFPQSPAFTYLHARALSLAERHDEAMAAFETALVEASSGAPELLGMEFYLEYGIAADMAGRTNKADELLRHAIELDPDNAAVAYNALGYMWVERGEKLDEAEQLIRRALTMEPNNAAFIDSLGWLYYKKGRYEQALEELLKASRTIDPPDAVVYDHVADAYSALNRTAEAMLYWKKALELDEGNDEIIAKIDALSDQLVRQPPAGGATPE
ncbi:MAG: tetratricopeptide repeat protein, partial [Chthoniobacterales bacterium]